MCNRVGLVPLELLKENPRSEREQFNKSFFVWMVKNQ